MQPAYALCIMQAVSIVIQFNGTVLMVKLISVQNLHDKDDAAWNEGC